MTWRSTAWLGVVGSALALGLAGCGDKEPPKPLFPTEAPGADLPGAVAPVEAAANETDDAGKKAVLDSVVQMLQKAAVNPGGNIFTIATERLNHFFGAADLASFRLSPAGREFLGGQWPEPLVRPLEDREFRIKDARHIEDCMLYRAIATRVAGDGDDLTRARRVFDWMVREVQLVPPGSLAPPGLPQAPSRPYDVLLRGMATEPGDYWSERSWLFMALCRQIGVDVGLLSFTRPEGKAPVFWACAALVDGKPYLFDARIGLPIPGGADGRGVATLEEAIADPGVLARLDLPGESAYGVTAADLAGAKFVVMLDSTLGYLSPRMRSLEKELSGKNRVNLYRDPAELRDAFAAALGARSGGAEMWRLPVEVEVALFNDPGFVRAAQYPIQRFDARLPLLAARMAQLRGDLDAAIQSYVNLRYNENPVEVNGKDPIPPEVQHDLDMYATYFLGQCQLERGRPPQAEFFFRETVRLLPEPAKGQPFFIFNMFRWGAQTRLAQLAEARGDVVRAIRYYALDTRTLQNQGNRLRARELAWRIPFTPGPLPAEPDPPGSPASAGTEPVAGKGGP